ncbi:hypothetical protein HPB49_009754 [Dermacentor silvarum]|uniref:Uncharacterized protein n=1 Tax=Dermacentor silvarum TaxID=543639 RepID=A0ACB8DY38_DERSI|nr:hypothetical protein HPB49_009754 [Dermacentor silvarum]
MGPNARKLKHRSPHLLGRHVPQMRVLHGSRDAVYGVQVDNPNVPGVHARGTPLGRVSQPQEHMPWLRTRKSTPNKDRNVKCAVCRAAGHETRRWPNKLIAAKRGKTTRQSRSRERSGQNIKKTPGHWFESTEEEDLYRRRSRSRSPHGSRAMSNTPSRDPSSSRASQRSNSPLPKKQQEVGAKPAKLQGYYTLSDPQNSKVATLGYAKTSPKGILLERTATALGLRAINQIGKPTRTGNSVSRDTAPDHVRKVILYTNLAETSITVVDVVYVQRINPSTGVSLLGTFPTSTASVQQRGGRAGRVRPGESHHLFTQDEFLSWDQFKHPEIQTIDLTRVVLDCKSVVANAPHLPNEEIEEEAAGGDVVPYNAGSSWPNFLGKQ